MTSKTTPTPQPTAAPASKAPAIKPTKRGPTDLRSKSKKGDTATTFHDTPWAKVLSEYMFQHRRPGYPTLSTNELATRIGLPRTQVSNWIYLAIQPKLPTMLEVMKTLGIPMSRLLAAYEEEGVPVPDLSPNSESAPSPRPYTPPPPTAADEAWDALVRDITASLTEAGMPPSVIAATIQRIRDRQAHATPTSHT